MTEQKTFRKIITDKEIGDIIKYCEEQPVPFMFFKPIIQYIQNIPNEVEDIKNDIDNKSKKS
tara:strand:- start:186 stop:371 length:186 start_codon:yes stop_codon:yes gene_type:complete